MVINTLPYEEYWSTENDINISLHCFNGSGGNSIVLKQGNIQDKDKMVTIGTETIVEDEAKIIQIEGHLTKYIHLAITGDAGLEIYSHSKRNPN